MSDFDAALERLICDPEFRAALAADPTGTLATYRLSADEFDLLCAQLDPGVAGDRQVERRTSKAGLFGLLSPLGGAEEVLPRSTDAIHGGTARAGGAIDAIHGGTATHDRSGLGGAAASGAFDLANPPPNAVLVPPDAASVPPNAVLVSPDAAAGPLVHHDRTRPESPSDELSAPRGDGSRDGVGPREERANRPF